MERELEQWREVRVPAGYLVSSLGRIMRAPYRAKVNRGVGFRSYGGKAWDGCWDGNRYIFQFRGKTYKVHRLVCEAFHGPAPFDGAVVMHLDEDSRNNSPQNLRWGTQRENLNAPGYLAHRQAQGRRVLDAETVALIKRRLIGGERGAHVAREFGIAPCTISNIKAGRSWADVEPERQAA